MEADEMLLLKRNSALRWHHHILIVLEEKNKKQNIVPVMEAPDGRGRDAVMYREQRSFDGITASRKLQLVLNPQRSWGTAVAIYPPYKCVRQL
jgi:hypothetical protein